MRISPRAIVKTSADPLIKFINFVDFMTIEVLRGCYSNVRATGVNSLKHEHFLKNGYEMLRISQVKLTICGMAARESAYFFSRRARFYERRIQSWRASSPTCTRL